MNDLETLDWPVDWPEIAGAEFPKLNGHQRAWIQAVADGLGHRVYVLQTRSQHEVTGILPLNYVAGPIFGKFLVSIPYLNTGGVWARDSAAAQVLLDGACELADRLNVKYLEVRHETPADHPRFNHRRTDKLHMRLALPDSAEALMKSYKSKLRSQIKKSGQSGLEVSFGGEELLEAFYFVFARNMRDLGTPVFSKQLFRSILREFGGAAEICVVRKDREAAAAALLVHDGELTEVPSASCVREFNRVNANMFMYRHLLERAIERGSRTFDFGRSSEGSGTYKFKEQWGAKAYPAVWQYYVRQGSPEEMRPDDEGNQRLIRIWQTLPVWLTKLIGPTIVRGIP